MTPILLFLHLPKTGGTSLNQCIYDQYRFAGPKASASASDYFCDGVYYYPQGFIGGGREPGSREIRAELAREDLRAAVGHFSFGIHRFLKPGADFRYITLIRDPVDRIASLYRHIRHFDKPDRHLHEQVVLKGVRLHDFASSVSIPELENDQTRRIAGASGACDRAMFRRAEKHLLAEFSCVGLTERFDESLIIMKRHFGWTQPLRYYPENVSADLAGSDDIVISAETAECIRERNPYDCELHALAKNLFERERMRQLDHGLDVEVAAFREENARMIRACGRRSNRILE